MTMTTALCIVGAIVLAVVVFVLTSRAQRDGQDPWWLRWNR